MNVTKDNAPPTEGLLSDEDEDLLLEEEWQDDEEGGGGCLEYWGEGAEAKRVLAIPIRLAASNPIAAEGNAATTHVDDKIDEDNKTNEEGERKEEDKVITDDEISVDKATPQGEGTIEEPAVVPTDTSLEADAAIPKGRQASPPASAPTETKEMSQASSPAPGPAASLPAVSLPAVSPVSDNEFVFSTSNRGDRGMRREVAPGEGGAEAEQGVDDWLDPQITAIPAIPTTTGRGAQTSPRMVVQESGRLPVTFTGGAGASPRGPKGPGGSAGSPRRPPKHPMYADVPRSVVGVSPLRRHLASPRKSPRRQPSPRSSDTYVESLESPHRQPSPRTDECSSRSAAREYDHERMNGLICVCTHARSFMRSRTHKYAHTHDMYAYIRTDDHSARSAHEAYNLKKEEAKVVYPQTPRGSRSGRDATPSPAVARLQHLLVQSKVFINASLRVCIVCICAWLVCWRVCICMCVRTCLFRMCVYIEFK